MIHVVSYNINYKSQYWIYALYKITDSCKSYYILEFLDRYEYAQMLYFVSFSLPMITSDDQMVKVYNIISDIDDDHHLLITVPVTHHIFEFMLSLNTNWVFPIITYAYMHHGITCHLFQGCSLYGTFYTCSSNMCYVILNI